MGFVCMIFIGFVSYFVLVWGFFGLDFGFSFVFVVEVVLVMTIPCGGTGV